MQRKWILKSTDQSESFQATLKCRWQHNPVSSKQLWLLQKKIVLMSCGEGKEAHTKKVLYRISKHSGCLLCLKNCQSGQSETDGQKSTTGKGRLSTLLRTSQAHEWENQMVLLFTLQLYLQRKRKQFIVSWLTCLVIFSRTKPLS